MARNVDLDTSYIKEHMDLLEMSKQDLAELAGASYQTVCRILREGTANAKTATNLENIFGEGVYKVVISDSHGVLQRFIEAEEAGNTYRLVKQLYVFQGGIDHPDGSFLVRHASGSKKDAEAAIKHFNGNRLIDSL